MEAIYGYNRIHNPFTIHATRVERSRIPAAAHCDSQAAHGAFTVRLLAREIGYIGGAWTSPNPDLNLPSAREPLLSKR
jgi:hypothetical protein